MRIDWQQFWTEKKPKSDPGFEPGLPRQNAIPLPLVPPPLPVPEPRLKKPHLLLDLSLAPKSNREFGRSVIHWSTTFCWIFDTSPIHFFGFSWKRCCSNEKNDKDVIKSMMVMKPSDPSKSSPKNSFSYLFEIGYRFDESLRACNYKLVITITCVICPAVD